MGMKGICCNTCGNKSYWKKDSLFEISLYHCSKCDTLFVHLKTDGIPLTEAYERWKAGEKLSLDEQMFFIGLQLMGNHIHIFKED